jgi:hypothetical protein
LALNPDHASFLIMKENSMSRATASLALISLCLCLLPVSHAEEYFPPPDSEGGWRVPKDAAQARELAGVDPVRLDQAGEQCQRCTAHGGLLVVHRGYLVFEKYWGRAFRNANPDMASTGKAFTSIACASC